MILEISKRRPGLDMEKSAPVTLFDGRVWFLPRPQIQFRRGTKPDGTVGLVGKTSLGPAYDAAVKILAEAQTIGDLALGHLELGAAMLAANYDLTDDEIEGLLVYAHDDEPNRETWADIVDIALGRNAPKPSTAGDA